MTKCILLAFSIVLLSSATASAQTDTITGDAGQTYYLLHDARLVTLNQLGQNAYDFYDSSLGRPESIDATNPFELLLYYPDYGTIVILDRTLSELRRLDLFANDAVTQPGALCRGWGDNIWVFDEWDYHLKQLGPDGRLNRESNDLRLELDQDTAPFRLSVYGNNLLAEFETRPGEVAVFTNYGRFKSWRKIN